MCLRTALLMRLRHNSPVTGIYDEPEMYELACAYRDIRSEADALERWYARHAAPDGPGSKMAGRWSEGGVNGPS